jgi:PadR family transcriptional regulator, regulatory protein PadR
MSIPARRYCRQASTVAPCASVDKRSISMKRPSQGELLQGTLPLLILRTLATGPNHGFAIARRIQQISKAVLRVEQGSLYPALHRMELDGLIEAYWGTTENKRQAKYYRLTRRGAAALAVETERWTSIASAIAAILQEA